MIGDVTKIFDDTLTKKLGTKPEVLKFLLKHERKNVCIQNLCYHISQLEKLSITWNAEKYRRLIGDVAVMFGKAALEHYAQREMSDAEKTRRQRQADSLKEAEAMMIDLEKETLRGNKDEDWAIRRTTQQVQEGILRPTDSVDESGT